MFRFVALSLAVLSLPSFAADAALCERSVNNVFKLMYAGSEAKLKLEAIQKKMQKDIATCTAKTAPAVAECHANAKSLDALGKCPKK
jgi:hypothetical protein